MKKLPNIRRGEAFLHACLTVSILIVILLAFWLRLTDLDQLPPGLSNDEAVNVVDSFHLARTGNFPLYEDPNRPEPLHRIVMAVNALFFGTSVWAFRLTSVFVGVLSVAAAYWAASECLYDVPLSKRRIASLAAAAVLTVALGHITLSRIIERGIFQPLVMLLFAAFLLRALRTYRRKHFIGAGIFLGILIYTYTAALVIPATLGLVGLSLLIFRIHLWRKWLPGMVVVGVVFAIIAAPVGIRLLQLPIVVIGRSAEVRATTFSPQIALTSISNQFFIAGDENPQYNVAMAPLLPPSFQWVFIVGLIALVLRVRQPSTALIVGFLILSAVPVIAANEPTHGLRIVGEFAALSLVVAAGVASLLSLPDTLSKISSQFFSSSVSLWLTVLGFAFLAVITLTDTAYANQIYRDYWGIDYKWFIHERELSHGEWFYRTDRRDLAQWLTAQDQPILVPLDELTQQTVRTWLMFDYPRVAYAGDLFTIPADTLLVIPWSLEQRDLLRNTRNFVLLNSGTIWLLPPLSEATHATLLRDIDSAEAITRAGDIDLIAQVKPFPADFEMVYEPITANGSPQFVFGNDEIQLMGWRGPDTLTPASEMTVAYTLDWQSLKTMGHEYSAFLQLQTQDFQRIAGDDIRILRWLYPTSAWKAGEAVSDVHLLAVPPDLQAGAYRLVVGLYPFVTPDIRLPIHTLTGEIVGDSATIGWVKVPQTNLPTLPENIETLDAIVGDFALRYAQASRDENGQIHVTLFWEALLERSALDATIFVHVVNNASGENLTQQDARPWNGQYPTFLWSKGEIVQTDYTFDIGEASPENLTLMVGMYTFPSLERLSVIQNGEPTADGRVNVGKLDALLVQTPEN